MTVHTPLKKNDNNNKNNDNNYVKHLESLTTVLQDCKNITSGKIL